MRTKKVVCFDPGEDRGHQMRCRVLSTILESYGIKTVFSHDLKVQEEADFTVIDRVDKGLSELKASDVPLNVDIPASPGPKEDELDITWLDIPQVTDNAGNYQGRALRTEFIVVDPEFIKYSVKDKFIRNGVDNIVIYLDQSIDGEVRRRLSQTFNILELKSNNPSIVASRLFKADLAIMKGGLMIYEACVVGTPVLAIPPVGCEWERRRIELLQQLGCCKQTDVNNVHNLALSMGKTERMRMSEKQKETIKGHGTYIITNIILDQLFKDER